MVLDDNMSQVCDEIFTDVHKLLRMCIVLKALHTINTCFSGKHASRTCRFNHSNPGLQFNAISICQK